MKVLSKLLVLLMLVLTPAITTAQEASTPAADDSADAAAVETIDPRDATPHSPQIGYPAVYPDDRGYPVMMITVTSVERNYQREDERQPDVGKDYTIVYLEVTNLDRRDVSFNINTLTLVDTTAIGSTYVNLDKEPGMLPSGKLVLAPGETVSGGVAMQIWSDLDPLLLIWHPDNNAWVVMHLND